MINIQTINSSDNAHLFLKVENDLVKIYFSDINYAEGPEDHVKIYTKTNPNFIKSDITITDLQEKLPRGAFVRIGRGFILSVDNIESVTKNAIKVGEFIIPVTEQHKEALRIITDQL